MAVEERRRYYSTEAPALPATTRNFDLDAMPLVKDAVDRGRLRRGDIERVVTLMAPELLDEMAAAARGLQADAAHLESIRLNGGNDEAVARDYGFDAEEMQEALYGPAELRYDARDDDDLAERKRIAREYGFELEDVA